MTQVWTEQIAVARLLVAFPGAVIVDDESVHGRADLWENPRPPVSAPSPEPRNVARAWVGTNFRERQLAGRRALANSPGQSIGPVDAKPPTTKSQVRGFS